MKTRLSRIIAVVILVSASFISDAQHLVPVQKKSSIEYRVYAHQNDGNQLFKGLFTDITGNIFFDPQKLSSSSFDISVNAKSASSENVKRDESIESDKFLSALKFPQIRIKSASIAADGKVVYIMHGNLTIKGTTKPVTIQFTATPISGGYLFRGSFVVSRRQFNIGKNVADIDDNVSVFVEINAMKK